MLQKRLTPRAAVKIPEDTLVGDQSKKASQRPIELILVPEDVVVCYLSGHEYMREWKRLKPAETAVGSSSDTLPHAQALFHLLSTASDPYWGRYIAQRQEAEWTYARMRERLVMELTIEPFTSKIKYGVESTLQRTKLSEHQQAIVADGVLPQGMEVWDDSYEGVDLLDVKAFTRIFSPTRPSMVDVYLLYPRPHQCQVFYRIHDPAPPAEERLKIFHIRSAEKVEAGRDGWQLVFNVRTDEVPTRRGRGTKDVERSTWALRQADAGRLHDVLFSNGEFGDKVSLLDAVLFVLASVGFHLRMRNPAEKYSRDGFGDWEPEFKISKCEWIATNLRSACGVPLPGEKANTRQVIEDDSS
ncbi:hypothetical protein C8Q80DRAFT_631931 [Daedaleopsis nitida]|nr:hypothetical protein C8Q80DRAFT_631931 [Daedaleopsis nitida]